jgi:uncharacterized membrane protein YbhN (UPF0104 family)
MRRNSLILTVGFLVVLLLYVVMNADDFRVILDVRPWYLVPIFIGYVLSILSNGLFLKIVLRPFGKFMQLSEAIYITIISSVANYIAPAGTGLAVRAVYLKKRYKLSYRLFVSTIAGNYLLVFMSSAIVGLLALFALSQYSSLPQYRLIVAAFAAVLGLSFVMAFVPVSKSLFEKFGRLPFFGIVVRNIEKVVEGWHRISSNRALVYKLTGLVFANLTIMIGVNFFVFEALGLSIGFWELMLFSVIGTLSLFVNITPGNIGIKEALYVFSGAILGLSVNEIVLVTLLDRSMLLVSLGVMWLFVPKDYRATITEDSAGVP